MRPIDLRARILLVGLCAAITFGLVLSGRKADAQNSPLRLTVNKWKVEPGDAYTLSWMEGGSVQPVSDFVIEECGDPQFRDKETYARYVVRAHRKSFENSTAFSHTLRYYRVRARAWVRSADEQQVEDEVVSNTVRVTLLGTDKAPPPHFPDDPAEETVKKPKKDGKDKEKSKEEEYPAMGRPDFVVVRITTEPATPVAGKPFKVRVTIRNSGVVPTTGGIQVKIDAAGRQFIAESEALKPGYTIDVLSPPVITPNAGPTQLRASADPFERTPESREDNNDKSVTITIGEPPAKPATASPSPSASGAPSPAPSPSASPSGGAGGAK